MSAIDSTTHETRSYPPSAEMVANATISGKAAYDALVAEADKDHEAFWARLAKEHLIWTKPFTKTLDASNAPLFKWFDDGMLNVSYNCLERNLENGNAGKTAIVFEADDGKVTKVTYQDLYAKVCRFANGLKALGFEKGERAIIYMPMSIEAVVAMQACARLGIIHSVVFGGFSAKSLQERIVDVGASLVIAADGQYRGGKAIPLKPAIDEAFAMGGCDKVKTVVVYKRTGGEVQWVEGRDVWMDDVAKGQADQCDAVPVEAEHPLFILYTSGSTGKPKGVQHSSAGYLLWAMLTMKWTFDLKPDDIFWCTADVGWVTGHTYVCYGPLATGGDRDHLRRRADLSRRGSFLEDDPGPSGHHLLHGTDRDPLADQGGRRPAEKVRPLEPAHPRLGRRADQSRSMALVSRDRRWRSLPDRRHVVADRDGRSHDHAVARRDVAQARQLPGAAARHRGRDRRRVGARTSRTARAAFSSSRSRGLR